MRQTHATAVPKIVYTYTYVRMYIYVRMNTAIVIISCDGQKIFEKTHSIY